MKGDFTWFLLNRIHSSMARTSFCYILEFTPPITVVPLFRLRSVIGSLIVEMLRGGEDLIDMR